MDLLSFSGKMRIDLCGATLNSSEKVMGLKTVIVLSECWLTSRQLPLEAGLIGFPAFCKELKLMPVPWRWMGRSQHDTDTCLRVFLLELPTQETKLAPSLLLLSDLPFWRSPLLLLQSNYRRYHFQIRLFIIFPKYLGNCC